MITPTNTGQRSAGAATVPHEATTSGESVMGQPGLRGVVVRQDAQALEATVQALGLPIEQQNLYMVSSLPEGRMVKRKPGDKSGWHPSAEDLRNLDRLLFVQEESNFCVNLLCFVFCMSNLRPLKLRFRIADGGDVYLVDRPFRCGGLCCCPLTMNLYRNSREGPAKTAAETRSVETPGHELQIGRIREDWDSYTASCMRCCFKCTFNHHVQRLVREPNGDTKFVTQYTVKANVCCCGPTNNCFGATCCRDDAVFFIYDNTDREVGRIQKTFAGRGDCMGACCRFCCQYDNYIIEFPEGVTTAEDRMLILASIMQVDYQLFEGQGGTEACC